MASILAHGLEPISEDDFNHISLVLGDFINQALNMIPISQDQYIPQLPGEELLNFYDEGRDN